MKPSTHSATHGLGTPLLLNRRSFMNLTAVCYVASAADYTRAHTTARGVPTGWVLPKQPAPPLRIKAALGQDLTLPTVLQNKVTAVQLMFTGCSSSCPPQGALFAALAQRLEIQTAQLLSISIDALGDTPSKVAHWQARFGQFATWRTAVADAKDVDRLGEFMRGAAGKGGTHTAQVFLFDRQGSLFYRTGDSPSVGELDALVRNVARVA